MTVFNFIDRLLFSIGKISILICVILNTVSAVGRYAFGSPIPGAYMITENFLMIIMIFLSLSYTWETNGFTRITAVFDKFPTKVKNVVMIFILIAGLGFFALVGYQGYVITAGEWINKNTFSGIVQWPTYLSRIWIPLGSLMIILRMLIELVKRVKTLLTN